MFTTAVLDAHASTGETDAFTFTALAGQSFSVALEPLAGGLDVALSVKSPTSAVIASQSAVGAGLAEIAQTVTASQTGLYTIEASNVGGTGAYRVSVLLNAQQEAEAAGRGANDSFAAAQDLAPAWVTLGGVPRAAVVGQLAAANTEGFEAPTLGPAWTTYSTSGGVVQIRQENTSASGGYSLWMMPATGDSLILNEATWTPNIGGASSATLSFWHHVSIDSNEPLTTPFTGHANGDAVSISADGVMWHPITTWNPSGTATPLGEWYKVTIDLDEAAVNAGITLGPGLQIRFQESGLRAGASPSPYGRGWDDIRLVTNQADSDYYRLDLQAGEVVSLNAAGITAGSLKLELFDASGNRLGEALPGRFADAVALNDFKAPTAGAYYARVSGDAGTRYTIAATRGAVIEDGPGNTTPVQDLTASGAVMGSAGATLGRVYTYDSFMIRRLNPDNGATIASFASPLIDSAGIFGLAVSPTSLFVAGRSFGSSSNLVELDPDTGALRRQVLRLPDHVTELAYFDGELFAAQNNPTGRIMVYDPQSLAVKRTIETGLTITGLTGSPRGLIATSSNKTYVIDGRTGASTVILNGPTDIDGYSNFFIKGLASVGNELHLTAQVSLASDWIYVYDVNTMALLRRYTIPESRFGLGGEPGESDEYTFRANAGDALTLTTATPGRDGAAGQTIDPRIELIDPSGTLVASNDNGNADGYNATLNHAASTTGIYRARVSAAAGAGAYRLGVAGSTAAVDPLTVTATGPASGSTRNVPVGAIDVDFSKAVLLTSVDPGDLLINGVPAASVTAVDGDTMSFVPAAPLGDGVYNLSLAAGAVTAVDGSTLSAWTGSFTVAVAPKVTSASFTDLQVLAPSNSTTFTFQFSEALKASNLDPTDFTLTGPWAGSRTPSAWSYDAGTSTLTLTYASLPEDIYTLTLRSGNGRLEDPDGVDLDGEAPVGALPPNVSGDGTAGGDFVRRFVIDGLQPAPSTAFTPLEPVGSMAYRWTNDGSLATVGEVDSYTFSLDAGQRVTVIVQPLTSTLNPTITLRNGAGSALASSNSKGVNQTEYLQTYGPTVGGTYRVDVGSAGGTGNYRVTVLLNALADEGGSNGTLASAIDISNSAVDLGNGASRMVVSGTFPQFLIRAETFDLAQFGAGWTTYSQSTDYPNPADLSAMDPARIRFTGTQGTAGGTNALIMDRFSRYYDENNQLQYTLNEATLTLDLAGRSKAFLNFSHADFGDAEHPFAGPFTGHFNADGIAISVDGNTWHPIWNAADQATGAWQRYQVDLVAKAQAAGITLNSTTRIRFQQYDAGYSPQGGRGWDEIAVTTDDVATNSSKVYKFNLAAGEKVTLAVDGRAQSQTALELFDATGARLAIGERGSSSLHEVIRDFVAPAAGTYYARLSADAVTGSAAPFTLAVVRGATFDIESNDAPSAAQDLTVTGRALGSVGITSMNRLFVYIDDLHVIRELDLQTGAVISSFNAPFTNGYAYNAGLATTATTLLVGGRGLAEVDPNTGSLIRTIIPTDNSGAAPGITALAALGDDIYAASGGTIGEIKVYDYATGALKRTITTAPGRVYYGLVATSDALLGVGPAGQVYRVDRYTGATTQLANLGLSGAPFGLAVIGGEFFVGGSEGVVTNGRVFAYDLATFAPKRTLTLTNSFVLGLGGDGGVADYDYYSFLANAGDPLTIETSTPGDAGGEFVNGLNPALDLYAPAGGLLATDENGAADGRNARITIAAPSTGLYRVRVRSSGAVRGEYVLRVSGNTGAAAPFSVTSTDVIDGARLDASPTSLTLNFSNDVLLSSLSASDLTVNGAPAVGLTIVDTDTVTFRLPAIGLGELDFALAAGSVLDMQGRPIQGFASSASVPAKPIQPIGGLVYSHATVGQVIVAGGSESVALQLDAGQLVSVMIKPGPTLRPTVELRSPAGVLLATASAAANGQAVALQNVAASAGGTYTLTVRGANSTLGGYDAQIYLNAAFESEPLGGSNDTTAGAQDLDPAMLALSAAGGRAAVVGSLESLTAVLASDGFESGSLGPAWSTYRSDPANGQISVTGTFGKAGGANALIFRNLNPNVGRPLLEAVWTVDLSGQSDALLSFAHAEKNANQQSFGGAFTNHYNADGIAISADGVTWYPVWNSPDQPADAWQSYTLDLAAAARAVNLPLGANFKIKFQAWNLTNSTGYRGWDNVSLGVPSAKDVYRFTLDAGQSATLALTGLNQYPARLELLDGSGAIVARGVAAQNIGEIIAGYVAPAAGTYYARVSGADFARYSLQAYRGATTVAEPNEGISQAPDITYARTATGVAGYEMGRLFGYDRASGKILEFNPATLEIIRSFVSPVGPGFANQSYHEGLATTETSLLIGGVAGANLYELDPDTGAVLRTLPGPGVHVSGMAYFDGEIFVLANEPQPARILVLDYNTGSLKRTLASPGYHSIAATPRGLLVTGSSVVYRVDPQTGAATAIGTGGQIGAVVNDRYFAASAVNGYSIYEYDATTLQFLREVRPSLNGNDVNLTALGADASYNQDFFRFRASAGDQLVLSTTTPGGGPGEFGNDTDPVIELYDPSGVLVAVADNNAPDGRNAVLSFNATQAGEYRVRVFAAAGSGEYVLSLSGNNPAPAPSFYVTATSPPNGQHLTAAPTALRVSLSDIAALNSVQAGDLVIDGQPATAVQVVDGKTLLFTLPALGTGAHSYTIGAGAITDIQGDPIAALSGAFEYDVTPPSVVSAQFHQGGLLPADALRVVLTFSEPLASIPFDSNDLILKRGGLSIGPASVVYDAATYTLTLNYTGLIEDNYTLTLYSADGAFEDTVGLNLDGDGNGAAGGDWVQSVTLETTTAALPPLTRAEIPGSLVYYAKQAGIIGAGGDTDRFTIELDPGQTIAAYVDPTSSSTLRPVLEILAPDGSVIGAGTAATGGGNTFVQALPVTGGVYSVRVSGAASSAGGYDVVVVLNAAIEEAAQGGVLPYRRDLAQDLDPSFLDLGNGVSRAAVVDLAVTNGGVSGDKWLGFTLAAGDVVDIGVEGLQADFKPFEFYSSTQLIAIGLPGLNNAERSVRNFLAPAAGRYYIKLDAGAYSAVITRRASLDAEPNGDPTHPGSAPRDITETGAAIGWVGPAGIEDDWYSIAVNAGDVLNLSTSTPGGLPAAVANTLDPLVELYLPDGTLAISNDNGAADGRNAQATFTAPVTGIYRVRVRAAGATASPGLYGEYFKYVNITGGSANLAGRTPEYTRVDGTINFPVSAGDFGGFADLDSGFSARWTGQLFATRTGPITLGVTTGDRAWVYVDDQLVMNVSGPGQTTQNITLTEGTHALRIETAHRQDRPGPGLVVRYDPTGSGLTTQVLPAERLYHGGDLTQRGEYVLRITGHTGAASVTRPDLPRGGAVVVHGDNTPLPNVTHDRVETPMVDDSGRVYFFSTLDGMQPTGLSGLALFRRDGMTVTPLIYEGQLTANGAARVTTSVLPSSLAINNTGQAAMWVTMTNVTTGTSFPALVRSGGPDGLQIVYQRIGANDTRSRTTLLDNGDAFFTVNDTFDISNPTKVVYVPAGQPAQVVASVGGTVPDGRQISSVSQWSIADNGGRMVYRLGFTDASRSLFLRQSGVSTEIVRSGQPVPGSAGSQFSAFDQTVITAQGDVIFRANYGPPGAENFIALFKWSGGTITRLVGYGDPTTTGRTLSSIAFSPFDVNASGQIVFNGWTTDQPSATALFRFDGNGLVEIYRAGVAAPDGNGTLAGLSGVNTYTARSFALDDDGNVAFYSKLSGTTGGSADDFGVYYWNGTSVSRVAREGSALAAGTVQDITGFWGGSTYGSGGGFNRDGRLVLSVKLTDSRDAVFAFDPAGGMQTLAPAGGPAPSVIHYADTPLPAADFSIASAAAAFEPLAIGVPSFVSRNPAAALPAGDTSYTFFADAGRTLAAAAEPTSAAITLTLKAPGGATLATVSGGPGERVVLPSTATSAAGTYELIVTTSQPDTVAVDIYRDADVEAADTSDGAEQSLIRHAAGAGGWHAAVGSSDPVVSVDEYTVTLTTPGVIEAAFKVLSGTGFADARLDLIGLDGTTVLASSTASGQTGFDQMILRPQAINPAGVYTLRLTTRGEGEYAVFATQGLLLDAQASNGRVLAGNSGAIGYRGEALSGTDSYAVSLNAGERVTVTIEAAAAHPLSSPLNTLDPMLLAYGPDGSLVALDLDSAADGRSARIELTAAASGLYRFQVQGESGSQGWYLIGASVQNAPALVRGDLNRDGLLTNLDIQAMLDALVDLEGYKATHHLSDADLRQIADINENGTVGNSDIQALLDLLTSGAGVQTDAAGNTPAPPPADETTHPSVPQPALPSIEALSVSPNPVVRGEKVKLTAEGVTPGSSGAAIKRVEFYRDVNGDGLLDPAVDVKLGVDTSAKGGWKTDASTRRWAAGEATLLARAIDALGATGPSAAATLRVNSPPTLGKLKAAGTLRLGQQFKLAAVDVADSDGSVGRVEFFRDRNNNGTLDIGVDELLGVDETAADGWALPGVPTSAWTAGSHTLLARAVDDLGVPGSTRRFKLTLTPVSDSRTP